MKNNPEEPSNSLNWNRIIQVIVLIFGLLAVVAYSLKPVVFHDPNPKTKKELLVYCGITMIQPMSEIASIIERQEDVKISIIKGGSSNLLSSIKFNNKGDLYLPGSESYIKKAETEGLVVESVHVGVNKAAMMVQKGNPKTIPKDLNALKNSNYNVVIGNPASGSIGKETKKILDSAGIFNDVLENARELTTDSKRLVEVLKDGEADLVINWYAASTWASNREHIDALAIDDKYAKSKCLVLGLLNSSKYPEIARKFMTYAASEEGRKIFDQYGLYSTREELPLCQP